MANRETLHDFEYTVLQQYEAFYIMKIITDINWKV